MKKINKVFKYGDVVIVTHESTTGPAHDLRDYLIDKTHQLLFISHPLLFVETSYSKSSYYQFYKKGRLIKKHVARHYKAPELLLYIKDSILTLLWSTKVIKNCDIFVGNGNMNAFAGLILKWIGKVKYNVFYCIDYVPRRFENNFINNFYHLIDKISVEKSDMTWNLSQRMVEARKAKWGIDFPKQITVPIGAWVQRIKRVPFNEVNKKEIIYLGALLEKQGIQLVIKAIAKVKKQIPSITFRIIGRGPYEGELKALVKRLHLEDNVIFMGYVEDHRDVENMLARSALAMAVYNPQNNPFTYYTDPGKVKSYIAAGVPVLITDFPYVALQVERKKCGIIVEYNETSIAKEIYKFLKDPELLKEYKTNALNFAKEFDWNKVFSTALGVINK